VIHEGQVLSSRYRLIKPLGRGSQAYVWVAEHLALGSQVAVKLIDPELAKQDDARARFQREATAAAKLRSAHVVQILDHGIHGDQPFIIMELLDGEDLFQRLDRLHHLSIAETSRIVTHVARALMRAHAEGIIHRDLKPENVFIAPNEDEEIVKVLDFGVAKIMTPHKSVMSKTGAGTLIGTPHYMSPEQVKGIGEIDSRSDLWSLAVIAYQSATGVLPFDSEGVGDLLIKISMDQPKKPSDINPDLPPEFDDWFQRASSKDPADRFQSARELADSLAKVAGLEPRSSVRRGAQVGTDLDWAAEYTNPGKAIAIEREVLRVEKTPGPGKALLPPPKATPSKPTRDSEIDIVEGSIPPPPKPSTPAAPKPPRAGKSVRPKASPSSRPGAPMWETHGGHSEKARAQTSTLLASSSGISIAPPELDGSGKRKVLWFVGIAFAIGAVALAATVIHSQMVANAGPSPAAAKSAKPSDATSSTATAGVAGSIPQTSGSASDPEVTKKGATAPSGLGHPPVGYPPPARTVVDPNGEIEVWVPLPDKEVPRH